MISFYAYDQAFHYLFFGYGAAISWLITACMLVLIVISMHWLRPEGERLICLCHGATFSAPRRCWLPLLFYLGYTLLPIVWLFLSTIRPG